MEFRKNLKELGSWQADREKKSSGASTESTNRTWEKGVASIVQAERKHFLRDGLEASGVNFHSSLSICKGSVLFLGQNRICMRAWQVWFMASLGTLNSSSLELEVLLSPQLYYSFRKLWLPAWVLTLLQEWGGRDGAEDWQVEGHGVSQRLICVLKFPAGVGGVDIFIGPARYVETKRTYRVEINILDKGI